MQTPLWNCTGDYLVSAEDTMLIHNIFVHDEALPRFEVRLGTVTEYHLRCKWDVTAVADGFSTSSLGGNPVVWNTVRSECWRLNDEEKK